MSSNLSCGFTPAACRSPSPVSAASTIWSNQIADQEAKAILHDKLMFFGEQLRGKDAAIFDKRLLAEDHVTLQEIGEKFGISRERVRQIETHLEKKLKAY